MVASSGVNCVAIRRPQDPEAGLELLEPDGTVWWYEKSSDLVSDLSGGRYRHWSLDAYLRRGRPLPKNSRSILDLFGMSVDSEPGFLASFRDSKANGGVTTDGNPDVALRGKNEPLLVDGKPSFSVKVKPKGIDLEARGHEVVKLLYAGFGSWIQQSRFDPEDVLQEVYKAILIRNQGKCPWDESKSSFGHYVHMVCRCVMSNLHRKAKRRSEKEQLGLRPSSKESQWDNVDVSETVQEAPSEFLQQQAELQEVEDDLAAYVLSNSSENDPVAYRAIQLIPLRRKGLTRTEMAEVLGSSPAKISSAYKHLKELSQKWLRNRPS